MDMFSYLHRWTCVSSLRAQIQSRNCTHISRGSFRLWIIFEWMYLLLFWYVILLPLLADSLVELLLLYLELFPFWMKMKNSLEAVKWVTAHTGRTRCQATIVMTCLWPIIVCCEFNWASDAAFNRCPLPFPWFKLIMIISPCQIPVCRKLCSNLLDSISIETVPRTWAFTSLISPPSHNISHYH